MTKTQPEMIPVPTGCNSIEDAVESYLFGLGGPVAACPSHRRSRERGQQQQYQQRRRRSRTRRSRSSGHSRPRSGGF